MSSLVLRSLLLPENNQVQSTIGKTKLKGLSLDNSETQDSNQSLSRLDSLRLSDISSQITKGRVPIQLTSPNEINKNTISNSYPASHSNSGSTKTGGSRLASLTGLTTGGKPTPNYNKPELRPLNQSQPNQNLTSYNANYSASVTSSYTQVSGSKKVIGNYNSTVSSSISFVDGTDKTSEKMSFAIAKIQDWDRKLGTLNAVLDEQEKSKTDMTGTVANGMKLITKSESEAVKARNDAIISFNEAIISINDEANRTGMRSPLFNQYKLTRDQMETMFYATNDKHRVTEKRATDYMTLAANTAKMTVNFLNPLANKY